jgi:hypothetical protein
MREVSKRPIRDVLVYPGKGQFTPKPVVGVCLSILAQGASKRDVRQVDNGGNASHTPVVWVLALGCRWASCILRMEDAQSRLQLATGVTVIGIAIWLLGRAQGEQEKTVFKLSNEPVSNQFGLAACHF